MALAKSSVPQSEVDLLIRQIEHNVQYLDHNYMIAEYRKHARRVIPNAAHPDILVPMRTALQDAAPFSAIRIGDSEAAILTYREEPDFPNLDLFIAAKSVERRFDKFATDPMWLLILRELLHASLHTADIVGVLGLWQPRLSPMTEERLHEHKTDVIEGFRKHYRGMGGQWRGRYRMLNWARNGIFRDKIVAPAHFYFAVVADLEALVPHAQKTMCITNRKEAVTVLRTRFPDHEFTQIAVGRMESEPSLNHDRPDFLAQIYEELPQDLRGCLCLIGAGLWAEIYCTWIKRRGGVAVDIGSGFDLLAGQTTRPIHYWIEKLGLMWKGELLQN